MKNKWAKFIIVFTLTVAIFAGSIFVFQHKVDAFDVWGTDLVSGFNNYKSAQEKNERLFKMYQYESTRPEVVLFGSSRVNYCTPAKWLGVKDEKVYNMGINAAHIPEEKYFFEYALRTHKPRIAAIGLDLLQFSSIYNKLQKGFSKDRLQAIAASPLTAFVFKSKETVFSFDAINHSFDVMKSSKEHPDWIYHERGWDTRRLKTPWPGRSKYRQILYRYHTKTYRKFKRSSKNYRLFEKMINYAKELDVGTTMYIHPVSIDFLTSYEINGQWAEFEYMKRQLVHHGPVWDFNYVNDVTSNRDNYIDPSHFKSSIGEKITRVLSRNSSDGEGDFGIVLTNDNIDDTLKWQRERFDAWLTSNSDTVKMLDDARRTKNKRRFQGRAKHIIGI